MKSISLLFVIALFLVSIGQVNAVSETTMQPENIPNEPQRSENLEDLPHIEFDPFTVRHDSAGLDSFIRYMMDTQHFPGVATWCSKNGQVVWQRSYGYANLQDSIAVTDTTSFLLASISKTFTATAIMQLWERGLFDLDEDVNNHLDFDVRNPYYPDSAITFRMLMTHTSTIHDNWGMLPPWLPGDHPLPLGDFVYEYLVPGGIYYSPANFYNAKTVFQYIAKIRFSYL
jgi:CubicO group peptidase (beta-lactamase class C family)